MANEASTASPWPFVSAAVMSPTLQTGTVLTRGSKGLGQVCIGELRMPLQCFTSLVSSSPPGDIVGWRFFKLESPNFVLSAADNLDLHRLRPGPGRATAWSHRDPA